MDQRKVNMLAREYCDLLKPKRKFKPVILSHCTPLCTPASVHTQLRMPSAFVALRSTRTGP